jgi:hypothetical protein
VSPGTTGSFSPVDLSSQGTIAGGGGAVGERFSSTREIDFVALGQAFYRTHPDAYDQLVVWANSVTTLDAFAFEFGVANEVGGIGVPIFEASREFGSGGRLRSIVNMDRLGKYPDDPRQRFFGENSTLSILGQETGHRWLAFLKFRDGATDSEALLGRDESHWSFFHDSDASHLEGNDIDELRDGAFRTVGAVSRYSALDQYAMGLRPASEVPPFFFITGPQADAEFFSAPRVGVEIRGTRRTVTIEDVIAAMGPRTPAAASAPRVFREAFVFVVERGSTETSQEIDRLERFRSEWEAFFRESTEGRGTMITRLR